MGTKKMKRREEEEIILENITSALWANVQTSDVNNSASAVLTTALGQFTTLILESLKSWQSHQSYLDADPVLKKYNDLLLMDHIHELEQNVASRCIENSTSRAPI
jgi:hypothetical protein